MLNSYQLENTQFFHTHTVIHNNDNNCDSSVLPLKVTMQKSEMMNNRLDIIIIT